MRPVVYTVPQSDATNGFTVPIPVDYNRVNGMYALQYLAAVGTPGTGTVQATYDNPFSPPAIGLTWNNLTLVSGSVQLNGAYRAFRVNTPVLNDTFTVLAQGATAAG